MKKGVSVIICCYNSSKVLAETLLHISRLKIPDGITFEIILVDNNSTDNTSETAKKLFSEYKIGFPYKIISEKAPGLSSARKAGYMNSDLEYIIFCDDDNHLDENYITVSFTLMENHPQAGVLGGQSEAMSNVELPEWFDRFRQNYSVGPQAQAAGDITWTTGALWGAGMVLRRKALDELFLKGYISMLADRTKDTLSSGGDVELCYALRLAGWKIWYDPELKLKHFIPEDRLNWTYLRKLNRGFGAQKAELDAYLCAFDKEISDKNLSSKAKWHYQSIQLLKKIRGYGFKKLLAFNKLSEGDAEILRMEKSLGKLKKLLKIRGEYGRKISMVRNAGWRKVFSLNQKSS